MAIKLLIDSASDINEQEAEKLGMTLLPIEVNFSDEVFLDGVDITPAEFYDRLSKSEVLPKTSQINPFRFGEYFKKATENGDDVVVITLSSRLSGTYQSACQAAEEFGGKVQVVDSMNACLGERLLALYAKELIESGMSAVEVKQKLDKEKERIRVFAVINTLKYLKMGGRISATTAFAGELLNIKPIVGVIEGEVKMVGKAMGMKKSIMALNSIIEKNGGMNTDMPFGVIWSGTDRTIAQKFIAENPQHWNGKQDEVKDYTIGSTIGTHIGPNAVGVAFFQK